MFKNTVSSAYSKTNTGQEIYTINYVDEIKSKVKKNAILYEYQKDIKDTTNIKDNRKNDHEINESENKKIELYKVFKLYNTKKSIKMKFS